MFAITKVYAKKVHAVNAIRMFVTNKGLASLPTEQAETFVLPAADGFQVANGMLNAHYGFAETEQEQASGPLPQRVPEGAVTSGAALEAVSEAIAQADRLHPQDKALVASRSAKLQGKSKLEQDKAAAKKGKVKEEKAPAAKSIVQNGARRPAKPGKTLDVWLVAERMHAEKVAAGAEATTPTIKEVFAELQAMHPGFNKTTCSIQFYACRTFNGWTVTK